MSKQDTTITVRVNADDKEKASSILEKMGLNISSAINMLLRQIIIQEKLPIEITLHKSDENEDK